MKLKTIGLIGVLFFTVSCAPPYRQEFTDTAQAQHWDKKHELLAFAYADKIYWSKEEKDNQYVFLYSRVPISKVAEQLASVLKDFDDVQSPKQREWRKYGETYGLMKDFEHEEAVETTIYARVHAADLENRFKQQLGEMPVGPEAESLQGYNIKRIYINKPLAEAFPFRSDQIEAAKISGTLKEIERAELNTSSTYDHKDADPNNLEDPMAFRWKPSQMSIRLINYKILTTDKPTDNKGNYIEGVRIIDGKPESSPCLKIFFPFGGGAAIVLLDPTREGEPGYGVPQILENLSTINNVQDVIRDGDILKVLFTERKKDAREVPQAQLFKVEISPINGTADVWEHDPKGYAVPFKYRLGIGDNYNVHIEFMKPDVDPNDPDAVERALSGYLDIAWISKEYTAVENQAVAVPGQVIEYYHPKKEFSTHVKARVLSEDDTKKLEFQLPDGTSFQGFVSIGANKFIEDKPFAVAYTEGEGDNGKRWWIEKSVNSDVYDRRKLISPPKDSTGSYSDTPELYDGSLSEGPTAGVNP